MAIRKWILVLLCSGGFLAGVSEAMELPLFYSAKEIRARIVDEQTAEPIEGAVVVARWVLAGLHGHLRTSFHIAEAITDKQGEFFIPAWGPKPRYPLTQLRHYSPLLSIFKHGYEPLELHNESLKEIVKAFPNYKTMSTKDLAGRAAWYEGAPDQAVQECMWNGLNIQLEKFTGTADRWLELIDNILPISQEEDKQLPQFFQALAAERDYFKANPVSQMRQVVLFDLLRRVEQAIK